MTRGELLLKIRESGGMLKTYEGEQRVAVFSLPNGEAIPSGQAHALIHLGRVVPAQDGLFGDSQVYKARDE